MTLDYPKEYSISKQLAVVAIQTGMESNLENYIQVIFDHVEKSIKAYQLNVECYITSLETMLSQDVQKKCAKFPIFLTVYDEISQ